MLIFIYSNFLVRFFGPDEPKGRPFLPHSAQSVAAATGRMFFCLRLDVFDFFAERHAAHFGGTSLFNEKLHARPDQMDHLIWPEVAEFRGGGASSPRASSQPATSCLRTAEVQHTATRAGIRSQTDTCVALLGLASISSYMFRSLHFFSPPMAAG